MNKPNIKLIGNRVLIKITEVSDKTSGGIIIPEFAKEKPTEGIVVVVGDGEKEKPMVVKENDRVFFSLHSGTEVTIDDIKGYVIMREPDVTLIVDGDKITPIGDRILVEMNQDNGETKTSGGIIIPETARKEREPQGKVVAVGGGNDKEPLSVKIGDTIFFGRFAGSEMKIKGKDFMIIRESDVFLITNGDVKVETEEQLVM